MSVKSIVATKQINVTVTLVVSIRYLSIPFFELSPHLITLVVWVMLSNEIT